MDLNDIRSRLYRAKAEFVTYQKARDEIARLETKGIDLKTAETLIDLCQNEQAELSKFIEDIITELLKTVFGAQYSFILEPKKTDGIIVGLRPVILENNKELRQGGGVRNVASFGWWLCFVLLNKDLAPVVVMDEYMNNLSSDNYPKVIDFVKSLQEKIEFQLVYITHKNFETSGIIQIERQKSR